MLAQATSIREKEAAEARTDEKEKVSAITNLKNAIQVLSKHQFIQKGSSSLLQTEAPLFSGLRTLLRDVADKYEMMVAGETNKKSTKKPMAALMQIAQQAFIDYAK